MLQRDQFQNAKDCSSAGWIIHDGQKALKEAESGERPLIFTLQTDQRRNRFSGFLLDVSVHRRFGRAGTTGARLAASLSTQRCVEADLLRQQIQITGAKAQTFQARSSQEWERR